MTELRNTWALREVYFDEHGNPSMHREPVSMTDEQLDAVMRKADSEHLRAERTAMTKADYLHDDLTRLNGVLVAEILGEASA